MTTTPDRRWLALSFVSVAQLMLVFDMMTMNISLPSVQAALGFSDADRQWVISAFVLTSGGLLLLGGRLADHLGLTRAYLLGLGGFAVGSIASSLAPNLAALAAARVVQGASEALLAPAVLSLISVTFTAPRERGKAFALFGAIVGGGGAVGLVLGGVLTGELGWQVTRLVNLPIALLAAAGAWYLRGATRPGATRRGRLDVAGALLGTTGLAALVAGCNGAAGEGWGSGRVIGLLAAGVALLAAFAVWEARIARPLLPPRILADRNRLGCYLAMAAATAGISGVYLFLSYYLQVALGYSAGTAGLALLPMSAAVVLGSQLIAGQLLHRVAPRALIVPGLLVAAAGMSLLTALTPTSAYLTGVLPGQVVLGLGLGAVYTAAMSTATVSLARADAGVGAAVVHVMQGVGRALGIAVLNTVAAAAATASHSSAHPGATGRDIAGLVYGNTVAAGWAVGIFTAAAVGTALLINAKAPNRPATETTPVGARR
ncbi:MFS transporter [Pseudonocardia acaciae]|uniref:MFS transporter n=1 Tax=Pseudonocardia acaciae TaxID=551276 RepID=UPI0006848230|nr:MFS transporter [Pseudonocardia acaciae]